MFMPFEGVSLCLSSVTFVVCGKGACSVVCCVDAPVLVGACCHQHVQLMQGIVADFMPCQTKTYVIPLISLSK